MRRCSELFDCADDSCNFTSGQQLIGRNGTFRLQIPSLVQQKRISILPMDSTASATAAWHCPIFLYITANQPLLRHPLSSTRLSISCTDYRQQGASHLPSNPTTLHLSPQPFLPTSSLTNLSNSSALSLGLPYPFSTSADSAPRITESPCARTARARARPMGLAPAVMNQLRGLLWEGN